MLYFFISFFYLLKKIIQNKKTSHITLFLFFTDMDLEGLPTESDRSTALRILRRELFRLATFPDQWCHESKHELTKAKLAQAGFFYTGVEDRVQCAFCLVIIGDWEDDDIPGVEHRRHTVDATGERYRFCPLIANFPTGNVTRDPVTGHEVTNRNLIQEFNRLLNRSTQPEELPNGIIFHNEITLSDIIKARPPCIPSMRSVAKREATYQNWPLILRLSIGVTNMAKAGFSCTGKQQTYMSKAGLLCTGKKMNFFFPPFFLVTNSLFFYSFFR